MASATPLVASRAGALPEVVGECAELVEPGDVDALTRVLGELLGDPGRRERLGAAGRVRVLELFSWSAVAAQTVAIYDQAIDRHSPTTAR
jgi:glycosyltransferase involved in cell wall biosynthesis